ncbi:hypothetical protein PGB28_00620 [Primorskyibacter aestuariivivens]|uniref:hypothetical protein n=1 Tax=Primorskyibacter aestuariivivens TaxID=1888912 RepID=UPI0023010192|nr:hypothetical protein [Primorskyibacter aestuariivivens]MDA7426941.1 hypothetical protein [Primorskyibacter aestuariivivens]
MSDFTAPPLQSGARTPLALRLLLSLPIIGRIASDLLYGDKDNIYYFLVILLTIEVVLIMTWGLPALAMSALAMVPICVTLLVILTRG